jgi:hypothetical protein
MPGIKQNSRRIRGVVAAWLALFFSFASLAPVAAQAGNGSSSGMACCKAKASSCCPKHRGTSGKGTPVIAAAHCLDCEYVAVNGARSMGGVPIRFQVLTVAIEPMGHVRVAPAMPRSQVSSHSLLQRPPPVLAA